MAMLKYRPDYSETQPDGGVVWRSRWMGGPSLAKVENCRMASLEGEPRITAFVQGEPDTYFSQPAVCSYLGKRVTGYLTGDDEGNLVFRHCYY
jgi:hypothetical protein